MLLAPVTAVLERSDRVALLERTRAEIHGLTISESLRGQGLAPGLLLQVHGRGGSECGGVP